MTNPFFKNPILNSPYDPPGRHWELDEDRTPTGTVVDAAAAIKAHHAGSQAPKAGAVNS